MNDLRGVVTALPTPLDANGKLKPETLKKHIEDSIAAGVTGFWINGATGCCIFLDKELRKQMLEEVCKIVSGGVKILAMVSAVNLADGIELARQAKDLGVDGVSAFPPLLYPTNTENIIKYLSELQKAADLPMTYYHVAGLTKVALESNELIQICKEVPLAAIKFSDLDTFKAMEIKQSCPNVSLYTGMEEIMLGGLAMDCFDGTVGASQNFMPGPYVDIYNAYYAGEIKKAQDILRGITKMVMVQSLFDFTATTYGIMNILGYDYGRPVAPVPYLDKSQMDICRQEMAKVLKPERIEQGGLITSQDFLL